MEAYDGSPDELHKCKSNSVNVYRNYIQGDGILTAFMGYGAWASVSILWIFVYILATPKVISGCPATCDTVRSWQLYSNASLAEQGASTLT